ncbi:MAG: T9SS type A sorting domain-containing protein [Saprospiraceae bacterium]|nr:T9SS type A sorting domain-containing protein [Saprospiraceae bacterium]
MKKLSITILALMFSGMAFSQYVFDTINSGVSPGAYNAISSVNFIDENNGWITAGALKDKVLKTTDGGDTWNVVTIDATTQRYYKDVQFLDANTGFVLSSSGYIFRTTNGGTTWEQSPWLYGWTTTEGYSGNGNLQFFDANTGYATRTSYSVVKITNFSTASGWTKLNSFSSSHYNNMHFADSVHGWVVTDVTAGSNGYHTDDAGATWTKDTIFANNKDINAVFAVDADTIYATSGLSRIYKTTDGGDSWNELATTGNDGLNGIHMSSPKFGFVVGQGPTIFVIDNYGTTVTSATVNGTNETLSDVYSIGENFAIAVGYQGTMLRFKSGGSSVAEIKEVEFNLFPNPAKENITIKFDSSNDYEKIEIIDMLGKTVKTIITQTANNKISIDISDLDNGIYFLKGNSQVKKFVVSK